MLDYSTTPLFLWCLWITHAAAVVTAAQTWSNWRCQSAHKDTWRRQSRAHELAAAGFRLLMVWMAPTDLIPELSLIPYIYYCKLTGNIYHFWHKGAAINCLQCVFLQNRVQRRQKCVFSLEHILGHNPKWCWGVISSPLFKKSQQRLIRSLEMMLSDEIRNTADEGWWLGNTSTYTQWRGLSEGSSLRQQRWLVSHKKYSSSCNNITGRCWLCDGQSPGLIETRCSPGVLQSAHPGRGLWVETRERIPKMTSRLRWSREQLGRCEKKERSQSWGSFLSPEPKRGAVERRSKLRTAFQCGCVLLQRGLLSHLLKCS